MFKKLEWFTFFIIWFYFQRLNNLNFYFTMIQWNKSFLTYFKITLLYFIIHKAHGRKILRFDILLRTVKILFVDVPGHIAWVYFFDAHKTLNLNFVYLLLVLFGFLMIFGRNAALAYIVWSQCLGVYFVYAAKTLKVDFVG